MTREGSVLSVWSSAAQKPNWRPQGPFAAENRNASNRPAAGVVTPAELRAPVSDSGNIAPWAPS